MRLRPLPSCALFIAFLALVAGTGSKSAAQVPSIPLGGRAFGDTAKTDTAKGPDTVRYQAIDLDYDATSRRLELRGQARLEYRGTVLTADSIWYEAEPGIIEAAGSPRVDDPQFASILGRRMRYNLKNKLGQVLDGHSEEGGKFYRGREVRRLPDKSFQLVDGDFCECSGEKNPDYYFSSERMAVDPGRVAVAAPVVLNVAEVPVAVAPFVVFPLGKERRSGLLTPKLGGDQRQGFYIQDLGAYWAMNRFMDARFSADITEGERGRFDQTTANALYRYKLLYWLDGNVQYKTYLRELGAQGSAWEVRFRHDQQLLQQTDKSTIKGEGSFVSDRRARRDNAKTAEEALDQTANADLQWQYRFGRSSFVLQGNQQHHLVTGVLTRELPRASFQSSGQLVPGDGGEAGEDDPWYRAYSYQYSAAASSFTDRMRDADTTKGLRTLQYTGGKQTLSLTATHQILRHIRLSPTINLEHDFTTQSYDKLPVAGQSDTSGRFSSDEWNPDNVFLWNAGASLSTTVYGLWMPRLGAFTGMRHSVTPLVGYTFYPKYEPRTSFVRHPRLGQSLGQERKQLLNLGLDQKLDAKLRTSGAAGRKLAANQGTSYSLLTVRSSTAYDFEADVRPWSDIATTYNTGLLQAVDLSGSTQHSFYDRFSGDSLSEQVPILVGWNARVAKSWSFGGNVSDGTIENGSVGQRAWSISGGYAYEIAARRVASGSFSRTTTQNASVRASTYLTREWQANYSTIYNFDIGEFVQHSLDFSRRLGCWNLKFGWTPEGPARGWSFLINIRDIPDVKIQAQSLSIRRAPSSTSTTGSNP